VNTTTPTPAIGDAVVDDGIKYRIRQLTPHAAHLAEAGPSWRRGPIIALADPGRLVWDKVPALWRGPTVMANLLDDR
jgi:hypothetical protein